MQFVLSDRFRTGLARHFPLRFLSHLPDTDEHLHNVLFAHSRDSIFEASHSVFQSLLACTRLATPFSLYS